MNEPDRWRPAVADASPLFQPLRAASYSFSARLEWPSLEDFNAALAKLVEPPRTESGQPVRFVAQAARSANLEDRYEPRIYLQGEVQTRTGSWHDFFNALVWMSFPRTKAALNAGQYEQSLIAERERRRNRTPVQDALTIFDEGGAIVVSRDDELLELLRRFAWKELFWARRERVLRDMRFFLFGHALYEKALEPHRGMTAKCLLLDVESGFLALPPADQLASIDLRTAAWFVETGGRLRTTMLAPLPILGVPGWAAENDDPRYYDDKRYFRDRYEREEIGGDRKISGSQRADRRV